MNRLVLWASLICMDETFVCAHLLELVDNCIITCLCVRFENLIRVYNFVDCLFVGVTECMLGNISS